MQRIFYSKKEKIGWMLISSVPLGFIIALLGEPTGKILSIIGFSEILSNKIGETITSIGGIIALLGIICTPIGIIKIIKVLRTQKKLDDNNAKLEKNKSNFTEDPKAKRIKKFMAWIFPVYYLVRIITSIIVNEKYVNLTILILGLLYLISFIILLINIIYFKKVKEKEGKLYNISLDLLYEGQIKNGKANGKGIAYYCDGTKKCEGIFKNGNLNGKGILYYSDGNIRYTGNFKNGKAEGKGMVYFQNGNIASQGIFKNDKLNGKGTMYYASGEIHYKGLFKNGLPNGRGTIYYINGNIASQGKFKNDKLEGQGIMYHENGEIRYTGNFKDGKAEGKGILYYDNGNKLQEGNFKENKLEGQGKMFYKSGDLLYEGEFKSGQPNGKGTLYDKNGYEIHKGNFRKGGIRDLTKRLQILFYKLFFGRK